MTILMSAVNRSERFSFIHQDLDSTQKKINQNMLKQHSEDWFEVLISLFKLTQDQILLRSAF